MAEQSIEMVERPGKYVNINTRIEHHGKDSEQLCADISVRGFHLEEGEVNFLLGPKAWNALFNAASKSKPAEPMFRNIDPLKVWDEFQGCDVSFSLGLADKTVDYEDAFVSKIVLTPQVGGLTLMDCLVSVEIEDTDDVARLLECLFSESKIALTIGAKHVPKDKKAQQKLDLGVPAGKGNGDSDPPTATH